MTAENTTNENLSELMDGEASVWDSKHSLQRLLGSEQQQAAWQRYHTYGDAMRGESLAKPLDFAAAVAASIADEPAILAPKLAKRRQQERLKQPFFGAAVAASVAVASVLGVTLYQQDTHSPARVMQTSLAEATPIQINAPLRNVSGTYWNQSQSPDLDARLNRYLIDHHERSAAGQYKGTLPYASFVSYDRQ